VDDYLAIDLSATAGQKNLVERGNDLVLRTIIQFCGLVAILAGILNILSTFPALFSKIMLTWVRRVGDISSLVALIGIYLYQRKSSNVFGVVAFLIAIAGVMMLLFSFRYEQAIMVYALGVILVGIYLLITGSFPRWVPLLWLLSVLIAIPGFFLPDLETLFSTMAAIAFGLGFLTAGFSMLKI
jgi:hypothetical protein